MESNYNLVSDEYYDNSLHPTIANLREATFRGLIEFSAEFVQTNSLYCELGTGKSMLVQAGIDQESLFCLDKYVNMLAWSDPGLNLVLGDAHQLPFACSFDRVFGSLCDPFNTERLIREVFRVLKPGGMYLFSVPDYLWVKAYRKSQGIKSQSAIIPLKDQRALSVTSYIYPYDVQIKILTKYGFKRVDIFKVSAKRLPKDVKLSRRFATDYDGGEKNIVTLYLSEK